MANELGMCAERRVLPSLSGLQAALTCGPLEIARRSMEMFDGHAHAMAENHRENYAPCHLGSRVGIVFRVGVCGAPDYGNCDEVVTDVAAFVAIATDGCDGSLVGIDRAVVALYELARMFDPLATAAPCMRILSRDFTNEQEEAATQAARDHLKQLENTAGRTVGSHPADASAGADSLGKRSVFAAPALATRRPSARCARVPGARLRSGRRLATN